MRSVGLTMLNKSLCSVYTNFSILRMKKLGCASVKKRINSFVLLSAFTNFAVLSEILAL